MVLGTVGLYGASMPFLARTHHRQLTGVGGVGVTLEHTQGLVANDGLQGRMDDQPPESQFSQNSLQLALGSSM